MGANFLENSFHNNHHQKSLSYYNHNSNITNNLNSPKPVISTATNCNPKTRLLAPLSSSSQSSKISSSNTFYSSNYSSNSPKKERLRGAELEKNLLKLIDGCDRVPNAKNNLAQKTHFT